jgi:hypothetical protein
VRHAECRTVSIAREKSSLISHEVKRMLGMQCLLGEGPTILEEVPCHLCVICQVGGCSHALSLYNTAIIPETPPMIAKVIGVYLEVVSNEWERGRPRTLLDGTAIDADGSQ